MKKISIRHGEVWLKPVAEIPEKAKLVFDGKEYIAGHSESGHHHVITADSIKVYELDGHTYLDIPKTGQITHKKTGLWTHGTEKLQGLWKKIIKRKFNPYKKIMEKVRD